ncbi:exopolysaccharide Pel transporter PelG [Clostridium sediminicola]|uniref:exopolysaccharide Pel transporter PelG n=1 Tax=Clostridium sediminicola TaxID=3114879 RepID=UPI0031F20CA5
MAGIGFELKKLFKDRGFLVNLRGYLYSFIVTLGPFLICTLMITSMQLIMEYKKVSYLNYQLFLASVIYSFIFSQIATSGFSMVITRYVSDKLYNKEFDKILPSFYGVISLSLVFASIPAIIFFIMSPLSISLKFITYTLYMQLTIMWMQAVYLTALKDYIKIVKGFLYGLILAVISALVLVNFIKLGTVISYLTAINIGVFIIISTLMGYIKSFFRQTHTSASIAKANYFEFLSYFNKYKILFFINLFYTVSLYVHNFLFWLSPIGHTVADTYIYAPIYDVPTFYAFFTAMPAMVIFIVSIETSFYEKYRDYYSNITEGGNLTEIENSQKDMLYILWHEIKNMMNLQFLISFILIFIGLLLLPKVGLTKDSLNIFIILSLGAYANIFTLIFMLIMLYFEDKIGTLIVSSCFLISNILFTSLTIHLGENYYGLGFFFATVLSLSISIIILNNFLKDIDYRTFCGQ